MSNVSREVNTETNGDDQGVAGDHVDGETHEVHEPSHVNDGAEDAEDDEKSSTNTAEEDEDGEEHGEEGGGDVLIEFSLYDLVSHPVAVPHCYGECCWII